MTSDNDKKAAEEVLQIRKWMYGEDAPDYQEYTTWYEARIDHMSTLFQYIDLQSQRIKALESEREQILEDYAYWFIH